MKIHQLRGQLRKAALAVPEVYKRPEDPNSINCDECGGSGRRAGSIICDHCDGSGLKLDGKKAPPRPRKSRLGDVVVNKMMTDCFRWGLEKTYLTLVSDFPAPTAIEIHEIDLGIVLTHPVLMPNTRLEGRIATSDPVVITASMYRTGWAGVIQAGVIHTEGGVIIAVIDFAMGGAGIVPVLGTDVVISWDKEAGIYRL